MRWPRRQWRSLLFAFVLSLCVHVLVLSSLPSHPPRVGDGRAPTLVVTIARPVVASPRPSPQAQRAAPAAPPVPRPRQPPKETVLAPAAKGVPVQAAARAPEPAASALPPRVQAADKERAFEAAETLDLPPTPLSSPEFGDVGREVRGRRLQASVWVDEDGVVRKAFVKRNEISEEVAGLLEKALASVRFAPGRKDGKAVPSVLDGRICFDDNGVLDTRSEDCLRPAIRIEGEDPAPR